MHPQAALEGIWYRPGRRPAVTLFWPLYALSLPYGAAIGLRNRLYNGGGLPRTKLPCPVISVGNLTVGGTGKTPLVMLLAELMQEAGQRPAILSRGFGGRSTRGVQVVSDGRRLLATPETAGDEPVLMARTLPSVPVLTGPDRVRTGKVALDRFGAKLLILDDAFQHRRLVRDLDIVLTDLALPFGNGCLLPAGPLREPVQALRRARIVIRTGSEAEARTTPASADDGGLRGFHRPCELSAATAPSGIPRCSPGSVSWRSPPRTARRLRKPSRRWAPGGRLSPSRIITPTAARTSRHPPTAARQKPNSSSHGEGRGPAGLLRRLSRRGLQLRVVMDILPARKRWRQGCSRGSPHDEHGTRRRIPGPDGTINEEVGYLDRIDKFA